MGAHDFNWRVAGCRPCSRFSAPVKSDGMVGPLGLRFVVWRVPSPKEPERAGRGEFLAHWAGSPTNPRLDAVGQSIRSDISVDRKMGEFFSVFRPKGAIRSPNPAPSGPFGPGISRVTKCFLRPNGPVVQVLGIRHPTHVDANITAVISETVERPSSQSE